MKEIHNFGKGMIDMRAKHKHKVKVKKYEKIACGLFVVTGLTLSSIVLEDATALVALMIIGVSLLFTKPKYY